MNTTESTELKAADAFKVDVNDVIVHDRLFMFPFLEKGSRRIMCGTSENADYTAQILRAAYNAGGVLNPNRPAHEREIESRQPRGKTPKRQPSRAQRAEKIVTLLDDASTDTEGLQEELQNWRDNMPENMQDGQKAQELDEAIDGLDTAVASISEAREALEGVTFPGMIG